MTEYKFATDSEVGTIEAADWTAAQSELDSMVSDDQVADGAWGWVENEDGERYEIGTID